MAFGVANSSNGRDPNAAAQLSEPSSVANSQDSSFDDSVASQASPHQPMSNIKSRFPTVKYSTRQVTPPTSTPDPSSQDRTAERLTEILAAEDNVQGQLSPDPHDSQNERPRSLYVSGSNGEHTSAQKRTADGQVKVQDLNTHTSPEDVSRPYWHLKSDSATSKGSQIGELSDHLKTRLSYAMIKVQHGWQTRSIDELESMTSQQASPVSPIPDLRRPYDSPRTNLMNTQFDRTGFAQSSERTTATPETVRPSPQMQNRTSRLDYAYPRTNEAAFSQPDHADRTYESFWREHSASNASRYLHTQSSIEGLSLAPPADIQPCHARRSNVSVTQAPALQTSKEHSFSSSESAPATPPRRHTTKPRTPSQNAAMEKDAVETLLFMSSPGNSGYHPQSNLPVTTLRNRLLAAQRSPAPVSRTRFNRRNNDQLQPNRPPLDHLDPRRLANDADVDKLLDEMPDEDSSSNEDDLKNTPPA